MSVVRFKIVVTTRNAMPWLRRCLESTASQTYSEYSVCVVDDASSQAGQRAFLAYFCRQQGWKLLFNTERRYVLENIVRGIESLACEDDDVVVTLDGDDWWAHDDVLERIARQYASGACDMTYGQHIHYPQGWQGGQPPLYASRPMAEHALVRREPWSWFHPRTFRYFLWKSIRDEDLRTPEGDYFRIAGDAAFLFPLLEMSGRRARCLDEPLYVYNRDNPANETKERLKLSLCTELYLRNQPSYPLHPRCQ